MKAITCNKMGGGGVNEKFRFESLEFRVDGAEFGVGGSECRDAKFGVGGAGFGLRGRKRERFAALFSSLLIFAALSAVGADYHWTGGAGDGLWSSAGNWADENGDAKTAAPSPGVAYTYNFGTLSSDVAVTMDQNVVFGNAVAVDGTGRLTLTTASGCRLALSETWFFIKDDATIVLDADMSGDTSNKNILSAPSATGTLVFALKAANATLRILQIYGGAVKFAEGSVEPLVTVHIGYQYGSQLVTPLFENGIEGGSVGGIYFDSMDGGWKGVGRINLCGKTLNVGGEADTSSTNNLPCLVAAGGDGGTLALRGERVQHLRGLPVGGTLAVHRADAFADDPITAVRFLFDDAADPIRDDVGSGWRLLAPNGMPEIVEDAGRGKVASFSGGAYLKGPDANAGLAGLRPLSSHNPYTVSFWLKPDAACDKLGKIFFWGEGNVTGGNYKSAGMRLNAGNSEAESLMFTIWGNNVTIPTEASVMDGAWHHVAVVYDGRSGFTIYYDGAAAKTFTRSGYAPTNKNFYIGGVHGGWETKGENPYTGLIDDFFIVSSPLTADDVALIRERGLAAFAPAPSASARASGTVSFPREYAAVRTLSGAALAGGVEMLADGATLRVGAEAAGAAATSFKGQIRGGDSTLVKDGVGYELELSGEARCVTNVAVEAGTLVLRRPLARAGLAALYGFDDAGAPGRDVSTSGFTIFESGSGQFASASDGVSGTALTFPGTAWLRSNQGFRPHSFPSGNGSYTVSVWIRPTSAACSGKTPVYCWGAAQAKRLSYLRFESATELRFSNYSEDLPATIPAADDGEWHHVATVYDADAKRKTVWFDGKAVAEKAGVAVLNVNGATEFQIGHGNINDGVYSGDMDEFAVYSLAWGEDDVAAEFARAAPETVAAETLLPEPVAHWTFDDDGAPGADSSANGLTLTASGGEIALESGERICGKAARFTASGGHFVLDEFPDAIPRGNAPFTVVVRYRPDTVQSSQFYPAVVMWGNAAYWSNGALVKVGTGSVQSNSARAAIGKGNYANADVENLYRTQMGTDRLRWMTAAYAYSPEVGGVKAVSKFYLDGECVAQTTDAACAIAARDFAIGSNYEGSQNFRGLVDDVQIYGCTLSAGQIRLVAERLEAGCGGDAAVSPSVLPRKPDVSVAAGATLKVASHESAAALSGEGTVEIAPLAVFSAGDFTGFSGTFTGAGTLAVEDGAAIWIGDGTSPAIDAEGTVTLGANVAVTATLASGCRDLIRAKAIKGAENLATWTGVAGKNRAVVFALSPDGTTLRMKVPTGLILTLR